nr:MAG TPA: hypothetical protein [Caudoviricetes sp.]
MKYCLILIFLCFKKGRLKLLTFQTAFSLLKQCVGGC